MQVSANNFSYYCYISESDIAAFSYASIGLLYPCHFTHIYSSF